MFISYPCGKDVVEQVLPHRDPFVWVTRVLECQPGRSIAAELDVDPALPLFAGHFPQHPVLPGVIIMEALAQAASCCLLAQDDRAGSLGFFAGIDKAKFREQVLPGDTITLVVPQRPGACILHPVPVSELGNILDLGKETSA